MERNQFWLFFGFALLLGLAAAAYQHAGGLAIDAPHLHSRLEDEGPMFSGNDHLHLKTGYDGNSSFAKIAGFVSHLPIHLGNGEKAKKPDAKVVAKVDPKKKKVETKKKKADTKIAPGITAPNGSSESNPPQEMTGNDGSGASTPGSGAATVAAGAGTHDNGLPKTLAEWQKYILATPNVQRTQFMIQMYQSHLLTGDIYFQVMALMIADTRDRMRALGVMAAGSAPSSNSFSTLLAEANSNNELSNTRGQATAYLRTYAQITNIKYLLSVLSENASAASVSVALNLLQIAAKPYATAANTVTTPVATAAANAANVARAQLAAYQMQRQLYINEQTAQGQEQVYAQNGQLVNAYNESSTGEVPELATSTPPLTAKQKLMNKYFSPFVIVVTKLVKSGSTSAIRASSTTVLAMLNQIVTVAATTTTSLSQTGSTSGTAQAMNEAALEMNVRANMNGNAGY